MALCCFGSSQLLYVFAMVCIAVLSCYSQDYGLAAAAASLRLSDVSLLLPYTSRSRPPVSYRLRSSVCAEWSVDPENIVTIDHNAYTHYHINRKCRRGTSKLVNISAVSLPKNGRVSATVTATIGGGAGHTHTRSGSPAHASAAATAAHSSVHSSGHSMQVAECQIFIDKVAVLQVATSTRLIYLGKHEIIKVDGYDNKGNKFTTLRGLPLDWVGIGEHLAPLSYSEAKLIISHDTNGGNGGGAQQQQQQAHEHGVGGDGSDAHAHVLNEMATDMKPVKGISTGKEYVTVQLNRESTAAHFGCKAAKATLFVVRQLRLQPRAIFMPVCTQAQFQLITTSSTYDDSGGGDNEGDAHAGDGDSNASAAAEKKSKQKKQKQKKSENEEFRKEINLPNSEYTFKLVNLDTTSTKLKMSVGQNGLLSATEKIESAKLVVVDDVTDGVSKEDAHISSVMNEADSMIYMSTPSRIRAEIIQSSLTLGDSTTDNNMPFLKFDTNAIHYYPRLPENDWYLIADEPYSFRLTLITARNQAMCVRKLLPFELPLIDNNCLYTNMRNKHLRLPNAWKEKYICTGVEFTVELSSVNNITIDASTSTASSTDLFVMNKKNKNSHEIQFKARTNANTEQFELKFSAISCPDRRILVTSTKTIHVTKRIAFINNTITHCPNANANANANAIANPDKMQKSEGASKSVVEAEKTVDDFLSVLLPYTGHQNAHSTVVFVEFGSGKYRFKVLNTSVAVLEKTHDIHVGTNADRMIITANNIGITQLIVSDFYNPANLAFIVIEVAMIAQWSILESGQREIRVNEKLEIPLQIRDSRGRRFSGLHSVPNMVKYSTVGNHVDIKFEATQLKRILPMHFDKNKNKNTGVDDATQRPAAVKHFCSLLDGTIIVRGLKSGYDRFAISLNNPSSSMAKPLHNTTKFISVYDPLFVEHKSVVIAIGIDSPYIINWRGGPLPWPVELNLDLLQTQSIEYLHEMEVRIVNHSHASDFNKRQSESVSASEGESADSDSDSDSDTAFYEKNTENNVYIYNNGLFSSRYQNGRLEFSCYDQFHETLTLLVSNVVWNTLSNPITSLLNIEVYCLPSLAFEPSSLLMGVGTRRNTYNLYPQWLKNTSTTTAAAVNESEDVGYIQEFYIVIDSNLIQSIESSDVVTVVHPRHSDSQHKSLKNKKRKNHKRSGDSLVAKRLGSATVVGKLKHQSSRVYIHPPGFAAELLITVSFKKFSMEIPSEFIIHGNRMIAHIEGLDDDRHILPQKHNFDDVFIEWYSEDANIVELASILPLPNAQIRQQNNNKHNHNRNHNIDMYGRRTPNHLTNMPNHRQSNSDMNHPSGSQRRRNNVGYGLSVQLITHSIGEVNIHAIVRLRNPPKNVLQSEFKLFTTITVIPRIHINGARHSLIILRPNSTFTLPLQFHPDTYLSDGMSRDIYNIKYISSQSDLVWIDNNGRVIVSEHIPALLLTETGREKEALAPESEDDSMGMGVDVDNKKSNANENVVISILFESLTDTKKRYPANQLNAFIVSVVNPTGLNLLNCEHIMHGVAIDMRRLQPSSSSTNYNYNANMQFDEEVYANQPFWSAWSGATAAAAAATEVPELAGDPKTNGNGDVAHRYFNPTENILCEWQTVSIKIALLDNLGRELHNLNHFKVESNDTSVVEPNQEIIIESSSSSSSSSSSKHHIHHRDGHHGNGIRRMAYANIQLHAMKSGFATIMFREQKLYSAVPSKSNETSSDSDGGDDREDGDYDHYVNESPDFLRTFLLIRVINSEECLKKFNIIDKSCHRRSQQQQIPTNHNNHNHTNTQMFRNRGKCVNIDFGDIHDNMHDPVMMGSSSHAQSTQSGVNADHRRHSAYSSSSTGIQNRTGFGFNKWVIACIVFAGGISILCCCQMRANHNQNNNNNASLLAGAQSGATPNRNNNNNNRSFNPYAPVQNQMSFVHGSQAGLNVSQFSNNSGYSANSSHFSRHI